MGHHEHHIMGFKLGYNRMIHDCLFDHMDTGDLNYNAGVTGITWGYLRRYCWHTIDRKWGYESGMEYSEVHLSVSWGPVSRWDEMGH